MRNDIIDYLQKEVYSRCKQPTNKFGMGCYYHIEAVVKNAEILAGKYGADKEVVIVATWLHDIASITDYGILRDDEEERIRSAAEDAELAGYYQQVQDALEGTGTVDRAEGIEDFTAGEVAPGERRSIREALATKGRTKGTLGAEDRKREEQLPVHEQQAKRNRRRAR